MILHIPCDEQVLRDVVDEVVAEAAGRGVSVAMSQIAARAAAVLETASHQGEPLTDMELVSVLLTIVDNDPFAFADMSGLPEDPWEGLQDLPPTGEPPGEDRVDLLA